MKGTGVAHGATTIVNAMPSGFGGALGVDLHTVAEVELLEGCDLEVEIVDQKVKDPSLALESFKAVMQRFGLDFGARITIRSEIPPAKGMKSSSAASNAVVVAALMATGRALDDYEVVRIGVDASKRARVTATGAFDDACASYFGGVQLTDNIGMKVLKSWEVEELNAIFLVPDGERYSGKVDMDRLRKYARASLLAFNEAIDGRIWQAMLINGMVMANLFGLDPGPIVDAVREGAVSAGLCGKGPAYCAITRPEHEGEIIDAWNETGHRIMRTRVRTLERTGVIF
ncbi:MAG: shikimate kinase [Candidatus Methanosuratus sp.]|nr:shikimate kinase [Candidatus Methanosuratincola sp.]